MPSWQELTTEMLFIGLNWIALMIYIALTLFQSYLDLEARSDVAIIADNRSPNVFGR